MKKLVWILLAVPGLAHGATVCKFKGDQGGNLKIEWKEVLPGESVPEWQSHWNHSSSQRVQVTGELAGYTYAESAVAHHWQHPTRCGGESETSIPLQNGYEVSFREGGEMCGFLHRSASLTGPNQTYIPLECADEN